MTCSPARFSPRRARARRELRLGDARVFLDTGTLETCAAEAAGERAQLDSGLEPEFPAPRAPRARALVLSVTRACNLECRYCYVRRRPRPGTTMSREVLAESLELLAPPGPWRVGFFGGEPLVAWELVREAVELASERASRLGARASFGLTTNGTLLSEERARFLAEAGFSLIVSLDGPRELHDAERCSRAGGSFDRALAGLEAAAAAGLAPRTTLRATFPLRRPALRARLEFLNELADRGLARAVSVEPAWPARGEDAPVEALPGEYLDAANWALARLRSGASVRFHHIEKALERILLMRPAGSECGAGFGYLAVAPDGLVYACHKEQGGPLGDVRSGLSERARSGWHENRWYGRDRCSRCWARNVCGGGCRAESVEHEGDLAVPWGPACAARRLQVRAALQVAALAPREALERMSPRHGAGAARGGRPAGPP